MLTSREKSGQRAPPSLTQNRLEHFSRQAQTAQLCLDIVLILIRLRLFLFLRELVDNFVTAHKPEVFAGDTLQIAAVALECQDFQFQLFVFAPGLAQAGINLAFILPKFIDAQQTFIAKDGKKEDEGNASGGYEVHPFLES